MSYQGPIEVIASDIQLSFDNEILRSVQKVGINVDKDELIRALAYDRNQYIKGYEDRDKDIVRCRECVHFNNLDGSYPERGTCKLWHMLHRGGWFCADGERTIAEE